MKPEGAGFEPMCGRPADRAGRLGTRSLKTKRKRRGGATRWSMLAALVGAGIATLATLWLCDVRTARLWMNTARLALGACAIAVPMGTFAAVAIFKTDAGLRRAAGLAMVGMLLVPLYLVTGAWDAGFGVLGWQTMATDTGGAREPWLSGWRAAIWIHAMAGVPWVVVIVGSALASVEAELEEDALTCAPAWRVVWHVSLARVAPALVLSALWIAIVATVEISATDFFQVRTFAEEVYTQAALGAFETIGGGESRGPISAIGLWLGLLVSMLLATAALRVAGDWLLAVASGAERTRWRWRLGRWRWAMSASLWVVVLCVVGLPLANFLYKAGVVVTTSSGGYERSWSLWKVTERVASAPVEFWEEFWLSTRIAALAATGAGAAALVLCWSMRGWRAESARGWRGARGADRQWAGRSRRRVAMGLAMLGVALCLVVPGPLLGVGLIWVLNQGPEGALSFLGQLYDTNFAPWLAQMIRALPLSVLVLWPALVSVPQSTLDAAALDGCGWVGRLVRIAAPMRWGSVAAAWVVSFAVAIGELPATIMVLPPQETTTISVRVFQLLHYGVDDRVAAVCLVMVLFVTAVTAGAASLVRWRV